MEHVDREFLIRARKAPVDPVRFRQSIGHSGHVEYLAQILNNALLVSKGHRQDTRLSLVLEESSDFSRTLSFDGGTLGSLAGWHETALIELLASILEAGRKLQKEESIQFADGICVQAISFERYMSNRAMPLVILDRKGEDIREVTLPQHPLFVMTDHIPMPRKALRHLARLGALSVSLGPVMLHASQCITLIHNQLDRHV
jgi:tRNA (pseudouridine54-N1)-methyltransferase